MQIEGINVIKSQINQHINKRTAKIKYIVIHDTSNYAKGADALAHVHYFATTDRKASADYLVDDNSIYQINDYSKYYTWHCGDGKGRFGITNNNSIGIEICVNADGNYQASINNAIALTYNLMQSLNISIDNVVRHYDASRKFCPSSMVADNWNKWHKFKSALQDYVKLREYEHQIKYVPIKYNGIVYMVSTINSQGYNYVNLRDLCKILDLSVDYIDNTIIINN